MAKTHAWGWKPAFYPYGSGSHHGAMGLPTASGETSTVLSSDGAQGTQDSLSQAEELLFVLEAPRAVSNTNAR